MTGEASTPRPHSVLLVLASSGWGGTEKAFVDLANDLSVGWRVSVAIPAAAVYAHRLAPDVSVHALRPGSRRNPWVLRHLAGIVRRVDPDVVHTHAARAAEMVYWLSRFVPVRHVATKHNTRDRWIFSRVEWVTAVSEQAASTIGGTRPVEVIHDGVEDGIAPPSERSVAPDEPLTLLAVGRLHRHKGFDDLVRAVARQETDVRLHIAGEGPERERLSALVRSEGVEGRVALLGHREDVHALMGQADALVVSSRTEGFSLVLVEGLHACPVVLSTPVGIAPELLPDALMLDAPDLAAKLADLHRRYAAYARHTRTVREGLAGRFSRAACAARYAALYERTLAGGPSGRSTQRP